MLSFYYIIINLILHTLIINYEFKIKFKLQINRENYNIELINF